MPRTSKYKHSESSSSSTESSEEAEFSSEEEISSSSTESSEEVEFSPKEGEEEMPMKKANKFRSKIDREPEIPKVKRNPVYQLPSLSPILYSMDKESIFSPIVIDSTSIKLISNDKTLEDIEEFKNSICIEEEDSAWKALERIYIDKYSVFKALLEVSMECIGQSSMPLVNTVFSYVHNIMNANKSQVRPDKIVGLVALIMAQSKSNGYDDFLNSEMKKGNNSDVWKVQNSKLSIKENISKNKQATIQEFDVLYICSPRYWAYPNYLSQLIKQKKYKKIWNKDLDLPKEFTNRQERVIRELSLKDSKIE